MFVGKPVYFLGNVACLRMFGFGDVPHDFGALPRCRPQLLGAAVGVAFNHGVRGGENVLRGTVVLFQQNNVRIGVVTLEIRNIANVGAAEGVNRLV